MSPRAAITSADLNRALKAAKQHGFGLRVLVDGTLLFLPTTGEPDASSPDSAAQKALAAWRRSA